MRIFKGAIFWRVCEACWLLAGLLTQLSHGRSIKIINGRLTLFDQLNVCERKSFRKTSCLSLSCQLWATNVKCWDRTSAIIHSSGIKKKESLMGSENQYGGFAFTTTDQDIKCCFFWWYASTLSWIICHKIKIKNHFLWEY